MKDANGKTYQSACNKYEEKLDRTYIFEALCASDKKDRDKAHNGEG